MNYEMSFKLDSLY